MTTWSLASSRTYWTQHGASGAGGWQGRREILAQFFDPVFDKLTRLEEARMASALAEPVSPAGKTGWPTVDRAVHDVRERFRSAATAADYSDVGRRCIALLETLSATVYDPTPISVPERVSHPSPKLTSESAGT